MSAEEAPPRKSMDQPLLDGPEVAIVEDFEVEVVNDGPAPLQPVRQDSGLHRSVLEEEGEETSPRKNQGTQRTAGVVASGVNMANTIMGAGLLSLPYAAREIRGILWALIFTIFFAAVTLLSIRVLVAATDITLVPSYAGLARELYGHRAAAVVHFFVFCITFSAAIAYLLVLADVLEPVFKNWGAGDGVANKYLIIFMVLVTVLIPLTFLRNLASLAKTSAISVVAEIILVIGLIVRSAHPVDRGSAAKVAGWGGSGIITAMPLFCFAFACTSVVHHVYAELTDPTPRRMTLVGSVALTICAVAYAVAAVCGYVAFGSEVDPDVLVSFDDGDSLATVIRLCVAVAVSLTYPLNIYPARQAVCSCFRHFRDAPPVRTGMWLHPRELPFQATALLVVCTWGIAYAASGLDDVLGFFGSHVGAMLLIVIPNALFLLHLKRAEQAKNEGNIVMGFRFDEHKGLRPYAQAAFVLGLVMWIVSIVDFYAGL